MSVTVRAAGVGYAGTDLVPLSDISFEIAAGEAVGLSGPDDGGRRTVFALLATWLIPTSGTLHIATRNPAVDTDTVRRQVACIPAHLLANTRLRADEWLWWFLASRVSDSATGIASRVAQILADTGVAAGDALTRLAPASRAALAAHATARAGAHVILLDSSVFRIADTAFERLVEALRLARDDGAAVVVSHSHDQGRTRALCDRVLTIAAGRVQMDRPTRT